MTHDSSDDCSIPEMIIVFPTFLLQYFVFDFHMPPVMLFDKIITLTVSVCVRLP